MRGVEHHQPCELAGGAVRDNFSTKAPLAQQRQSTAMVQMGVRQQDIIDSRRIEANSAGVLRRELTAALKQPAINKDSLARAFHQMTRSGHVAIGTMKAEFQHTLPTHEVAAAYVSCPINRSSGVP